MKIVTVDQPTSPGVGQDSVPPRGSSMRIKPGCGVGQSTSPPSGSSQAFG
jgi:hypothetical protein